MSSTTTGSPRTMTARRARIATIIATSAIGSQEELGNVLATEGVNVTQATLSRDLDAIGAVKSVDGDGRQHYVLSDQASSDTSIPSVVSDASLARTAADLVVRAEAAGNIVVVHTPPGAAQFLAGHLDRSMLLECVGSVAGDDTIIIVMRTAGEASDYCATLLTLAELRRTT
jgi:transcriptional regulator of arginine metabolism